jgi:hypothetical protein
MDHEATRRHLAVASDPARKLNLYVLAEFVKSAAVGEATDKP